MSNIEKIFVSYDEFGTLANMLVDKLKETDKNFVGVYGIPRGGVSLATHISYHLEIPLFLSIDHIPLNHNCEVLICDDVCDSGKTIKELNIKLMKKGFISQHITYATLHVKPRRCITPDIFIHEFQNTDWVVYPWEAEFTEIDKEYMNICKD